MSEIQFDENVDLQKTYSYLPQGNNNGITGFVIKMGLATDKKQAQFILLITTTLFFGLSIAIPLIVNYEPSTSESKPELIPEIPEEVRLRIPEDMRPPAS